MSDNRDAIIINSNLTILRSIGDLNYLVQNMGRSRQAVKKREGANTRFVGGLLPKICSVYLLDTLIRQTNCLRTDKRSVGVSASIGIGFAEFRV